MEASRPRGCATPVGRAAARLAASPRTYPHAGAPAPQGGSPAAAGGAAERGPRPQGRGACDGRSGQGAHPAPAPSLAAAPAPAPAAPPPSRDQRSRGDRCERTRRCRRSSRRKVPRSDWSDSSCAATPSPSPSPPLPRPWSLGSAVCLLRRAASPTRPPAVTGGAAARPGEGDASHDQRDETRRRERRIHPQSTGAHTALPPIGCRHETACLRLLAERSAPP